MSGEEALNVHRGSGDWTHGEAVEGNLLKLGDKGLKTFKRRFFKLFVERRLLRYWRSEAMDEVTRGRGFIDLQDATKIVPVVPFSGRQQSANLRTNHDDNTLIFIITKKRRWVLKTSSAAEQYRWLVALHASMKCDVRVSIDRFSLPGESADEANKEAHNSLTKQHMQEMLKRSSKRDESSTQLHFSAPDFRPLMQQAQQAQTQQAQARRRSQAVSRTTGQGTATSSVTDRTSNATRTRADTHAANTNANRTTKHNTPGGSAGALAAGMHSTTKSDRFQTSMAHINFDDANKPPCIAYESDTWIRSCRVLEEWLCSRGLSSHLNANAGLKKIPSFVLERCNPADIATRLKLKPADAQALYDEMQRPGSKLLLSTLCWSN